MQLNSKTAVNEIPMLDYELTIFLDQNSNNKESFKIEFLGTKAELYSYLLAELPTQEYAYVICIEKEIYVTQYVMQIIYFIEMITNSLNEDGQFEQIQFMKINIVQNESFEESYNAAKSIKELREKFNL
jgi:hypothetical protein